MRSFEGTEAICVRIADRIVPICKIHGCEIHSVEKRCSALEGRRIVVNSEATARTVLHCSKARTVLDGNTPTHTEVIGRV